ncbi:MAG: hypothetical protein HRU78_10875 [Gammaproteobacteria bacterium]|nr:MAG: hypothetical protein HRU78_10875 [Gammaproteobacteria bacterium]
MKTLDPGWKFTPLYRKCPKCGHDLTKHFIDTKTSKAESEQNKSNSGWRVIARVACGYAGRAMSRLRNNSCLKWMIDPFAKADEETAKGDQGGWDGGECRKQSSSGKCKNENADYHKNLIPVVKRKFSERIFHYFLGRNSF